jgi:hypothetical protein
MIDEIVRPELEALLRATLNEMIPKVVNARVTTTGALDSDSLIVTELPRRRGPRPRRLVLAGLTIAASVVGLVGIITRDTDPVGNTTEAIGEPAWYRLLRPALPARFNRAALTQATETQLWFVAISQSDGKALEIQLGLDGDYSETTPTTTDGTGTWYETPQGYTVVKTDGLQVSVSCDIGARGRDFAGPPNYCDMSFTGPFTKPEIRTVTEAVATTFDRTVFTSNIGSPMALTIDAPRVIDLIASALPSQQPMADTDWGPADRVFDNLGGDQARSTSIRLVRGVDPSPTTTEPTTFALYDDAAAGWIVAADGTALRASTTDTSPESLDRLQRLALTILGPIDESRVVPADPTTSTPTSSTTSPTTVRVRLLPSVFPAGFDDIADDYTTATEGADGSADQVRLFVTADERPAVLMAFISPNTDPETAITTMTDRTRNPDQPSFRLGVTLPSGKYVLFASGGLLSAEVQQIAEEVTDDPTSEGVLLGNLPRDMQEITWRHNPTNAHAVTWNGPDGAQITMNVESAHGLDAIGNALAWPITVIDTPNGRAFVSVEEASDGALVQVGVVIDGRAINIEARGVSVADITTFLASIAPATDADWAAKVP